MAAIVRAIPATVTVTAYPFELTTTTPAEYWRCQTPAAIWALVPAGRPMSVVAAGFQGSEPSLGSMLTAPPRPCQSSRNEPLA